MTTDIERLKRMALNAGATTHLGIVFCEPGTLFDDDSLALVRFAQAIAEDCAKQCVVPFEADAIRALYR